MIVLYAAILNRHHKLNLQNHFHLYQYTILIRAITIPLQTIERTIRLKAKLRKIYSQLIPSSAQKLRYYYAENYESALIDDNMIVYETRDGSSIVDSPLAIFLYLVSHEGYEKYHHTWIIKEDNEILKSIIPDEYRSKVDFVIRGSIDYVDVLLKGKYLISNSTFESFFVKRPGQIYINTWHGTPLKLMGFDTPFSISSSQNVIRNFLMTDYLLSPNSHTSNIFINSYKLAGIYPGEVVEGGYPRIDVTISTSRKKVIDKINQYGAKVTYDKPIILYTPTWKGSDVNQAADDIEQIINETLMIANHFKEKYQVLVKVHPFIFNDIQDNEQIKEHLISDYIDANEVLAATDILVTDYSSIFFDFLITDKPIIFYVWDKDLYQQDRGMYLTESELPGPSAENLDELMHLLENVKQETNPFSSKYQALKRRMVPYDDGFTTKRYVEYIFDGISSDQLTIHKVDSDKTKVLLYPGGMKDNGITSSFLNLLENIDYDKYDVTVIGSPSRSKEILDNYDRMNKNVRPMFRFGIDILTRKERGLNRNFMSKGVPANKRESYPEIGYTREMNRLMANLRFDTAIDFSAYSYYWGRHILGANAKKYCAFLHSDVYSDAHREIDGKMPMLKNMLALFSIYYRFDKLLSVSPMTMEVNKQNLRDYIDDRQMSYVMNTINIEKILGECQNSDSQYNDLLSNSMNPPEIVDFNIQRQFLTFFEDGTIDIYKKLDDITAERYTTNSIHKGAKISEFANCRYEGRKYRKVSIDGMYVGWIADHHMMVKPIQVEKIEKVHMIGTISGNLNFKIWKTLGTNGQPREARTKAKYFEGQYMEVNKIAYTDQGRYFHVYYRGKELGWMSSRPLTRIHKLPIASPINVYFKQRAKQIHDMKKIGFSDTLVPVSIYATPKQAVHDQNIYSEPPKTTDSTILEQAISNFVGHGLFIDEIQFINGHVYARFSNQDEIVGYTDMDNLKLITFYEYEKLLEEEKQNGLSEDIEKMNSDSFNFITMGRLSPEKNQLGLIEAFALFVERHPNSNLYFLGKGPMQAQLDERIEELALQDKVFLKGHMSDPFSYVSQADVFVLPSFYEGQPMVLLETLTLGMKILASNIPANIQVLGKDERYGMLTNGTTPEAIYEGMERIFNSDKHFDEFDYKEYNQTAIESFYKEVNP